MDDLEEGFSRRRRHSPAAAGRSTAPTRCRLDSYRRERRPHRSRARAASPSGSPKRSSKLADEFEREGAQ